MAAQRVLFASALLIQVVFGQYLSQGSYVTGNSVVDNNIYLGNAGLSVGNSGLNLVNSGLNLGNAGLTLAGSGLNNVGLIGGGLGSAGLVSSGLIGSGLSGTTFSVEGLNVGSSGPLAVTTISPIGPSGLAVVSENVIEGNLLVSGSLPFLSAVAFEGALPSAGSGLATCGCGSGSVGIISEGLQALPASGLGLGVGLGGLYY